MSTVEMAFNFPTFHTLGISPGLVTSRLDTSCLSSSLDEIYRICNSHHPDLHHSRTTSPLVGSSQTSRRSTKTPSRASILKPIVQSQANLNSSNDSISSVSSVPELYDIYKNNNYSQKQNLKEPIRKPELPNASKTIKEPTNIEKIGPERKRNEVPGAQLSESSVKAEKSTLKLPFKVDLNNNRTELQDCQTRCTQKIPKRPSEAAIVKSQSTSKRGLLKVGRTKSFDLKTVRFADKCGQELEEVQCFESFDHLFFDKDERDHAAHALARKFSPIKMKRLLPEFRLALTSNQLNPIVKMRGVKLESVHIIGTMVAGSILTKDCNSSQVFVRYTLDNWITFDEIPASFDMPVTSETARYTFEHYFEPSKIDSQLSFCIRLQTPTKSFWDNNDEQNFVMKLV